MQVINKHHPCIVFGYALNYALSEPFKARFLVLPRQIKMRHFPEEPILELSRRHLIRKPRAVRLVLKLTCKILKQSGFAVTGRSRYHDQLSRPESINHLIEFRYPAYDLLGS